MRGLLDKAGWSDVAVAALTPDASARRYWRVVHPQKGRAVLCHDPTGAVGRFQKQADALRAAGLSSPVVIAHAWQAMLIEDFGATSVTHLGQNPMQERCAYGVAGMVLAQAQTHVGTTGLSIADVAHLVELVAPFCTTYPVSDAAGLHGALAVALESHMGPASVWIHRDFHADNLMWLPYRTGMARLGILDFQDAMRGPVAYDLASLVYDARRDVSAVAQTAAVRTYLEASGREDTQIQAAMAVLSLQRNLRILGLFAQFAMQGRASYQRFVPRVRGHVARALTHPACQEVARFVPEAAQ